MCEEVMGCEGDFKVSILSVNELWYCCLSFNIFSTSTYRVTTPTNRDHSTTPTPGSDSLANVKKRGERTMANGERYDLTETVRQCGSDNKWGPYTEEKAYIWAGQLYSALLALRELTLFYNKRSWDRTSCLYPVALVAFTNKKVTEMFVKSGLLWASTRRYCSTGDHLLKKRAIFMKWTLFTITLMIYYLLAHFCTLILSSLSNYSHGQPKPTCFVAMGIPIWDMTGMLPKAWKCWKTSI